MTCLNRNKQGTETLLDYCAGTLEQGRAEALEDHVRECAACRELIDAQKNLWKALDAWEAPGISADFDDRLYARIASEPAHPVWRVWWNRISLRGVSWKPMLVGVAAVAVLAVGLTVYAPKAADTSRQIRPESVDVEQLEVTFQDLDLLTPPTASAGRTSAGKM
jgi:anti-sigma-K factor RskA